MIIKGGSRKSASFFAKHLMKTEDNERVTYELFQTHPRLATKKFEQGQEYKVNIPLH